MRARMYVIMPDRSPSPKSIVLRRILLIACGVLTTCQMYGRAQARSTGSGTPALQLPLSGRTSGGVSINQSAPVPSGASASVQVQVQGAYAGSVATEESVPQSMELTLLEATQRGLKANLGIISSATTVQQALAQVKTARSALLPSVSVNASENASKLNLAAQGFSASAFGDPSLQFPRTVGPFHYYDLEGSLQQSVLDVTAVRNLRAQGQAGQAATLQAKYAREEVVLAVTGVYLQFMADLALVDRQQAEVAYAEASYKQARAQVDAGNKAPIEANRSLVEWQTEQQRLRSQTGEVQKRQIQLARLIGLPLGTHIHPKERFEPLPPDTSSVQDAVRLALSQRLDFKASEAQLRSAEEARKAASAERLPSASLNGTYGLQGINPNQGVPVFQASVSLSIPVFQGGRIAGNTAQAAAVVNQRRAELADRQGAIEAEVRNAYIDLQVAGDQVSLADNNRKLATQTLQQSQDRFAVGVADSVEVVNSEQSLAAADHDYVNSLFSQHVARITLAHATGGAEQQVPALFERNSQ